MAKKIYGKLAVDDFESDESMQGVNYYDIKSEKSEEEDCCKHLQNI